ncbi:MAG TPA: hypothetical protein VD970_00345, partial [Acetobacteraceae bacterium]|nr:hypothetical protein [Acetobacteraceae bacterium]
MMSRTLSSMRILVGAVGAAAIGVGSVQAWQWWMAPPALPLAMPRMEPIAPPPVPPARPGAAAPDPLAQAAAPVLPRPPAGSPSPPAPARVAPAAPRFDVVRVGARGTAVIAGRASPGAEVVLLADGERELGRARADARGEWVILPADPLPPGSRELSLRARLNGEETPGADTVVVLVPEPPVAVAGAGPPAMPASGALAVLMPAAGANAAPRVLQGPPEAALPRSAAQRTLALSTIDYGDAGDMRFAGTAPPGATVRVYVG